MNIIFRSILEGNMGAIWTLQTDLFVFDWSNIACDISASNVSQSELSICWHSLQESDIVLEVHGKDRN